MGSCNQKNDTLKVWLAWKPYSVDPYDYDASVHHFTFRSLFAPLVSNYYKGEIKGIVAESWKASDDKKEWDFLIRPGLTFANGDLITPEIVALSLNRMAKKLANKNSRNGLLEFLDGEVTFMNNEVKLRFIKSMPKVLDLISFGMYGVVHPSDYDQKSGDWVNPRKITSSYCYNIKSWDDSELKLALRDDCLFVGHKSKFKEIIFGWNEEFKKSADMFRGTEEDISTSQAMDFYGGAIAGISFARINSSNLETGPFSNINIRKLIRSSFYTKMLQSGLKLKKSFFPLFIAGVKEIVELDNGKKTHNKLSRPFGFRPFSQNTHFFSSAFIDALESLGGVKKELSLENVAAQLNPNLKKYDVDIMGIVTNILIEHPEETIRFMVQSKEGIRIPDTDGRLNKAISKSPIDMQEVNQIIWDQAVIWPIAHFSYGLWAKKFVDLSELNPLLPPVDFLWVGQK